VVSAHPHKKKNGKKKVEADRPTHLDWFFSRFSENAAAMAYSTHHPSHPPPYPTLQLHHHHHQENKNTALCMRGEKKNISVIGDTVISRSFWINHVQKIANFIVEQVIGN